MKNQFEIKNLPCPQKISDAVCKSYVDNSYNDSSIAKNTTHIDLNDKNITSARFIQVNHLPQIDSHLAAELYVDTAIDEPSLVRNNRDNVFENNNLTKKNSITVNTQAVNDNQVFTKAYVDQFDQENERSRRDLGIDFFDELSDLVRNNKDKDLNIEKLTNLDSLIGNREPTLDDEMAIKNFIDDELDNNTILRINQTLQI